MPLDDRQLNATEQTVGEDLRASFAGLSLTKAQRQRLHDRFRQRVAVGNRTATNAGHRLRDEYINESHQGPVPGRNDRRSRRHARLSRGLERAAVVIVLLLFVGGVFVARTMIPGSGSSRPGAIGTIARTGMIAFASDRSGSFQIYTVNADGSELRQLTHGDKPNFAPVWSPDGRQIAYTQAKFRVPPGVPIPPEANPPISVYVMNADGSNARDLTPAPAKLSFRTLTWSPDGKQIATDCPPEGQDIGSSQICVLNVDGSVMRRISPSDLIMSSPSWSPDGRWIAAVGGTSMSETDQLYLLSPDGGEWRKLSNNVASPTDLAWSPDGSRIAIVEGRPAGSAVNAKITVVNVDGSGQRDLETGDAVPGTLAWSPDSSRILFTAGVPRTDSEGVDVINADGSGLHVIVPMEASVESASWSPDGRAVAYTRYLYAPSPATPGSNSGITLVESEIDIVNLDGSAPVTVFSQTIAKDQNGLDGTAPAWRPMVAQQYEPTPTAVAVASATLPPGIRPWGVGRGDPAGLSLHLSKTTVKPGEIITRTIDGTNRHPDVITNDTLMLEAQIDGEWRWIYFLGLAPPYDTPTNVVPSPDTAISAVGVGPNAVSFSIPNIPPGNYRVRQDLSIGPGGGDYTQVTLYATITVVAP